VAVADAVRQAPSPQPNALVWEAVRLAGEDMVELVCVLRAGSWSTAQRLEASGRSNEHKKKTYEHHLDRMLG
jgi:hypothetical protein